MRLETLLKGREDFLLRCVFPPASSMQGPRKRVFVVLQLRALRYQFLSLEERKETKLTDLTIGSC